MVQVRSAVKVVGAVVGLQLIILTVYGDNSSANPVGIAADGRAEVGRIPAVAVQIIVSQHHIRHAAVLIRHHHGNPHASQSDERSRYPILIGQRILVNLCTVGHFPE